MTVAVLVGAIVLLLGWSWHPGGRRVADPDVNVARPTGDRTARDARAVDPLALASWCDGLARSVRGGASLRAALVTVEPPPAAGVHLAEVTLAVSRGASLADALGRLTAVPPHLDLVVVVLRAVAAHGGAGAEPLDRAAAALRQRAAILGERRAHSAQARMSAVVMTVLPGAMLALLLLTSAPVRAAAASGPGLAAIALGAAANAAGWWWMRRLISGRSPW